MTAPPPIKFLLVDDREANLVALTGLLQRDGLELLTARSGPEALELLLIHDIALALIDVQMPEMNGFELAELMRGTERTRKVPIIFLTAGAVDSQRRIRGYETGAVDFLAKPIDADSLLNKAATFLELARQRQALAESNAKLAEADRRKDEFLAMLAHELRNPLAPMRNVTEILRSQDIKPEDRDRAHQVLERQIENMSRMIDDLLDVSRITEGKIELRRTPVRLDTILNAAVHLVRPVADANGQQLIVNLPSEPVVLDADPTRLEQVFGNLLHNACKYGGKDCRIELSAEKHGDEVSVTVRDNGPGIAPDLLPRVFDLFVQSSRTLDRAHGGLGIGLTVVHRLVKLHGGSVKAHSDGLGHGSEFVVRLPTITPATTHIEEPEPTREAGSLRLLIVDDNQDAAVTLAMLQELDGHVTRVTHSGPEALEAVPGFKPEVVLLDIGLPDMDGYEVVRRLRTMPGMQDAFVVAMTGYGSDEDRALAAQAGFDEHLVKPPDLQLLSKWLKERATTVA
ncbi:response regulator [Luteolibacter soli]|uniref:histidine kinase n=1 Tax=Luteolibacter soli TaxID=3135280 RepID=A0ABU9AP78_9BACT